MVLTVLHKCMIILFILKSCRSSENQGQNAENITKLYELITGAIKDDLNKVQISRRVINDSVYLIHINKLKDVNGFKMHNIVINRTDTNSTIFYLNNPLESKLPHPFMTLEQFKDTIVEQRMKDRKAFLRSKKVEEDRKKWADIKATAKLKKKSTFTKQIYTKAMTSKKTGIGANTKSVTEKQKDYKIENKSITVTTKDTKDIQNTKKHTTLTIKENGTVKNVSSSSYNLKEMSTLSTDKLTTSYSRVKLLNYNRNSSTEHKFISPKNNTNFKVFEQNITTVLEDKYITPNDRESTTNTKEKMAARSGRESNTVEKHQATTVNQINSTNSNANGARDGESTVTEKESTVINKVESATLGGDSTVTEKESTLRNELESTSPDGESTVTGKKTSVDNEVESTTLDKTEKESTVNKEYESKPTETESTVSDEVETTAPDEGPADIETELTSDEQLTTNDEKEVTDDDDERETSHTPVSEDTEEFSAESSTTTTTTTTTLPPTTRERWSRPRVFMGEMSDGNSTSS